MIPSFPNFKKLEVTDKIPIELHTAQHKPYSDFNFTNLFIWDTADARKISELNGNLVVYFTDYMTNEPALSFLGTHACKETASQLLTYAAEQGITPHLRYMTEECAETLKKDGFVIEEDTENFDYIFSTQQLADPQGSAFKVKRQMAKRFARLYPDATFCVQDTCDTTVQKEILSLFDHWRDHKVSDTKYDLELEGIALRRLLNTAECHNLILSCVYHKDHLVAFSIDEMLSRTYAISHFVKGDTDYTGVYEFLNEKTAQYLLSEGVALWNWEQDLNIEGLRRLKISYRPVEFLKKYRVSMPIRSVWEWVQSLSLLGFKR